MRIGTWNLGNLFRPGGPSGPTTEAANGAKLAALAAVVAELAPDVLAVQEVGDPAALDDLAARLDGYDHRATAAPDERGIRNGFLSRLPLRDVREVSAFPDGLAPVQVEDTGAPASTVSRAVLVAGVDVDGTTVTLLGCHLKSKLLSFPGGRFSARDEGERARYGAYALHLRAAEAVTVRAAATGLLDGRGAERAVVVLGDLNDVPDAATTQILLGPPGSEIGTSGFDTPDRGDGQRLWNLAPRIAAADRWSREFRGRRELIDHVLVSRRLVESVGDGDVVTGPPGPSIDENPNRRRDEPGSDHRPVVAEIRLG